MVGNLSLLQKRTSSFGNRLRAQSPPRTSPPSHSLTAVEAEHTVAVLLEPLRPFLVSADSEASSWQPPMGGGSSDIAHAGFRPVKLCNLCCWFLLSDSA